MWGLNNVNPRFYGRRNGQFTGGSTLDLTCANPPRPAPPESGFFTTPERRLGLGGFPTSAVHGHTFPPPEYQRPRPRPRSHLPPASVANRPRRHSHFTHEPPLPSSPGVTRPRRSPGFQHLPSPQPDIEVLNDDSGYTHSRPLSEIEPEPREPPPRNPRRRLRVDRNWRPASSVYDCDEQPEEQADQAQVVVSQVQLLSTKLLASDQPENMDGEIPTEDLSLPSSPEPEWEHEPLPDSNEVSPVRERAIELGMPRKGQPRSNEMPSTSVAADEANNPGLKSDSPSFAQPNTTSSQDSGMRRASSITEDFDLIEKPLEQTPPSTEPHTDPTSRSSKDLSKPAHTQIRAPHLGSTTTVTGPHSSSSLRDGPSSSLGQKVKYIRKRTTEAMETRPPWKGASGRQPQVKPVRDQLEVRPLNIPNRKAQMTAVQPKDDQSRRNSHMARIGQGASSAVRSLLQGGRPRDGPISIADISAPRAVDGSITAPQTQELDQEYPPDLTHNASSRSGSPASMPSDSASTQLDRHNPQSTSVLRKPAPTGNSIAAAPLPNPLAAHPARMSPNESLRSLSKDATPVAQPQTAEHEYYVQPSSRFSITTYATSDAETPRASLDNGVSTLESPIAPIESVMSRKRPVREGEPSPSLPSEPIIISLKSSHPAHTRLVNETPSKPKGRALSMQVHAVSVAEPPKDRRESTSSLGKALPLAPPEISSADDRVANLNARLRGLAHRRNNIQRSMKQIKELMPQNNLLASDKVLIRREQEKQKIQTLEDELANVQREEYELGIKLHRAHKRLDREIEFEPTGLWVRRVTS